MGFELYPQCGGPRPRRIAEELPVGADLDVHEIRTGDALSAYGALEDASVDADVGRERLYSDYLDGLAVHAAAWRRVLRPGRYAAVLVGDFRHGPRFHMLHADVAVLLDAAGLVPSGLFVIAQRNRPAMPYGYPTAFVPQAAHMFVVVARRPPGNSRPRSSS